MKRVTRLALYMLALIPAGCGTSPPTNFFTLKEIAPAARTASVGGVPIVVDAVKVPAMLDRREMVRLTGSSRVIVDSQDRWAAPFADVVRDALAQDMAARLPEGLVRSGDEISPGQPRRDLVVDIRQFAPQEAKVTLDADWALLAGESNQAPRHHEHIVTTVNGSDAASQAAGMSAALGQFADRIAAAIARDASTGGRQ
jgi:uncharacterized lipoprotein YmbA